MDGRKHHTLTHPNQHIRNVLKGLVEKQLDSEGEVYVTGDVDADPTDDAFAFTVHTLRGGIRITVENE